LNRKRRALFHQEPRRFSDSLETARTQVYFIVLRRTSETSNAPPDEIGADQNRREAHPVTQVRSPKTLFPPTTSLLYFRARAAWEINFSSGWAVRSAFSNTACSDILVFAAITRTRFWSDFSSVIFLL